jgi:hypothetical protein
MLECPFIQNKYNTVTFKELQIKEGKTIEDIVNWLKQQGFNIIKSEKDNICNTIIIIRV